MAKPTTTHVIEIDTGIGEPAFIPLTLGQELQPISVGKKGMWRIESPRVMDVHAFVYFDGNSLFLQSADEGAAATVDGFKIGKAWTELHAPCKIEIGTARLRYRSLLPDSDGGATVVRQQPPVQAPRPANTTEMRAMPQPPPPGAEPPLAFPKADRPFRPGEFSQRVDDESTRIAPVAPLEAGASRVGTSGPHVRPAAGRPIEEDVSTRPDAAHAPRAPTGAVQAIPQHQHQHQHQQLPPQAQQSGPYAPIGAGPMQGAMMQSMPPMMGGASMPPGMGGQSMPPMGAAPPGYSGPMFPSASYPQAQFPPNAQPSGSYPQPMQGGPSMPPGGFGSMTPQGGSPPKPAGPFDDFAAKWKEMSVPKRVAYVLLPIAMLLAVVTLFTDDDAPPPRAQRAHDAGAVAVAPTVPPVATTATPPQPNVPPATTWPKGVPCPPPNWPPNVPLPCVPDNSNPPPPTVEPPPPTPPDRPERPGRKDAGAPPSPPSAKTLERQAVDAVAAGNKELAAQLYEQLAQRDPNNRVYAEAARILRAKLDAGVP